MCMFLLCFMVAQTLLQPWRCKITNAGDGVLISILVLILICGALATDFTANECSITILGLIIFFTWSGIGLAASTLFVYSLLKKHVKLYRFFICHHKAGAGTLVRLLKTILPDITM